MYEKAKILFEIMDEEDKARVERGEKPLYTTEDVFYALHPECKKETNLVLKAAGFNLLLYGIKKADC